MSLLEKIPAMSDGDLTSLRNNAQRLSETGSKKQQTDAAELLPAIELEVTARQTAKAEASAAAKAARAKPKKKAAPKAAAAPSAEAA